MLRSAAGRKVAWTSCAFLFGTETWTHVHTLCRCCTTNFSTGHSRATESPKTLPAATQKLKTRVSGSDGFVCFCACLWIVLPWLHSCMLHTTHTRKTNIYIYICIWSHTHPMIHPSLLVNCSSTILCLRMLSPKSINHRDLRGFLHFAYTDLCLLCSFLVYVNHPKPKPESGSASALKHLSPSQ